MGFFRLVWNSGGLGGGDFPPYPPCQRLLPIPTGCETGRLRVSAPIGVVKICGNLPIKSVSITLFLPPAGASSLYIDGPSKYLDKNFQSKNTRKRKKFTVFHRLSTSFI